MGGNVSLQSLMLSFGGSHHMLTFQDAEAVQYITVASLLVSCSAPVKMQQPPLHLEMYQLTVRPRSQSADGYKAQSQLRVVSKQPHQVKLHHHAADLVRYQDGVSLCQVLASVTSKQSCIRAAYAAYCRHSTCAGYAIHVRL